MARRRILSVGGSPSRIRAVVRSQIAACGEMSATREASMPTQAESHGRIGPRAPLPAIHNVRAEEEVDRAAVVQRSHSNADGCCRLPPVCEDSISARLRMDRCDVWIPWQSTLGAAARMAGLALLLRRGDHPQCLLSKPAPPAVCLWPTDLGMAGFFRQGVWEYCLLSGSETARLESNQAEAFMADHHALDSALF